MNEYEIIKFKNDDIELSVNVSPSEDTVWLTKEQIAILFDRDRSVISKHVNNILKEKELDDSTCAFFAQVQKEGNFYCFNISWKLILYTKGLGYRVSH